LKAAIMELEKTSKIVEDENEKYNKPCPYNKAIRCVQHPEESCGCNPCEECENYIDRKVK